MPVPTSTQLLPRGRRYDLETSLQARIHDPLWLLCRQWQMGEFQGEDAGTPVQVAVETDAFGIDRLVLPERSFPYQAPDAPLEAVVEREGVHRGGIDLRTRAQWGALLLRQLEAEDLVYDHALLQERFGFDAAARERWRNASPAIRVLGERGLDANTLLSFFHGDIADARLAETFPQADASELERYRAVIHAWRNGYQAQVGDPERFDAWVDESMEYFFLARVATDAGNIELEASEYPGGRLDWDAFRVRRITTAGGEPVQPLRRREQLLPSQVSFAGMPAPRFWELEDGSVDFGHPQAVEQDLGRLLLAEFVMAWGNDWFLLPLLTPTGALVRVNELLVTDTFGVTTRILPQSVHAPHWRMGRLSGAVGSAAAVEPFLFVPPVLPHAHQAAATEEVLFLRDETANIAWAIEQQVADPLGNPQAVADQVGLSPTSQSARAGTENLAYRVITDLPEHWIPLVPVRDPQSRARFLVRAGLIDEIGEELPRPQGQVLARDRQFRVHDEEIPRAGAEVTRSYQLARWYDGKRVLWVGRYKRPSIGGMRSTLAFDTLIAPPASETLAAT